MIVEEIFKDVSKAFPDIKSKIKHFSGKSFMWSSPITKTIYYNKNQVESMKFSKIALKGAIAHEMSHQVAYHSLSFLGRLIFKFRYKDFRFKRDVERKADKIAVKRGFGKELIKFFKELENKFEKQRLIKIKKTHLSIKEIQKLISK